MLLHDESQCKCLCTTRPFSYTRSARPSHPFVHDLLTPSLLVFALFISGTLVFVPLAIAMLFRARVDVRGGRINRRSMLYYRYAGGQPSK
jgi:hypothetical protein